MKYIGYFIFYFGLSGYIGFLASRFSRLVERPAILSLQAAQLRTITPSSARGASVLYPKWLRFWLGRSPPNFRLEKKLALYYVTSTGVVPQSYLDQGYQALDYSGQTITVLDDSTYTLSPDLAGRINFQPPSDGFISDPLHPFTINIDESNPNLTTVDVSSVLFRGNVIPTLNVADGVNLSGTSVLFDDAFGSTINLGSNVVIGDILGGDGTADIDVVNIGNNTTVGNIRLQDGGDTISMGDNNTIGAIDLGGTLGGVGDAISGGTGNVINGDIEQNANNSYSSVEFSGATTITGHVYLGGGKDTFSVGDNSSIGGYINTGPDFSVDDADVLNIGSNSVVDDYINTGVSSDAITLGESVTLKGGWNAVNSHQGSDTLTVGRGLVSRSALDMGVLTSNDDLLIVDYGAGNARAFRSALADGGFTDPDGDGVFYGGANKTFVWNGVTYNNIDHIQGVCFADGTLIETDRGAVAIENLSAGDLVLTLDNGLQPIRWIGSSKMSAQVLEEAPRLRPIRIGAGALGENKPETDLLVSPQHRVLVRSTIAQRMFGAPEVLVAAKQLCQVEGIDIAEDVVEVTYLHMLFDRHEVVFSNGAETESLYTGAEALKCVGPAAAEEIFTIFPELREHDYVPVAARPLATGRMGRKLAVRHAQNNKQLVK